MSSTPDIEYTDTSRIGLDAWFALPEDMPGELVNGRLVEEEVPDSVHEVVISWLIQLFRDWVIPQGGLVLGSGAKLAVRTNTGRMPDLTVYFPDSPKPPRRGLTRVAPDIAVEVVSPTPRDGRRDRIDKVADYAAFGVHYYWIVDPEMRTLEILALGSDDRYVVALGATEGVTEHVPGCAGLVIDLDALWTEIERLASVES